MKTQEEINAVIGKLYSGVDLSDNYSDSQIEKWEGALDALRWVIGEEEDPPISDEDLERGEDAEGCDMEEDEDEEGDNPDLTDEDYGDYNE